MKHNTKTGQLAVILLVMSALALFAAPACNSNKTSTNSGEGSSSGDSGSKAQIDTNCIGDHIETPPGAFHYSYLFDDTQDFVSKEADITPDAMQITIKDKFGAHSYHGVRSDSASWNSAVLSLLGSGLTGMTARVQFVKDNSATRRTGTEETNGYQTTKYSIDTTNANPSDRQTFATLFGAGSYDHGTIWVAEDGCPVKLILDEARQRTNGVVEKAHYEIAVIRK
jgi:hypothetical protein